MNIILSLFLSIAMLFSGAADLPAVPETADVYTLKNISITYGDETVDLAPELELMSAVGSGQLDLGLNISMDGETLLPMNGRIEEDKISFSLSEDGNVYSIDAAVLDELTGLKDIPEMEQALESLRSSYESILALQDAAVAEEMEAVVMEALLGDASFEEEEVDLDGVALPVKTYDLMLTGDSLAAVLDALLASENQAVKDYIQMMLDTANLSAGTEYASFAEALAAEEADMEPLPLQLSLGEQGDISYESAHIETQLEGMDFDMDAFEMRSGDIYLMEMNSYMSGDDLYSSMSVLASGSEDGAYDVSFDVSSGSTLQFENVLEDGTDLSETIETDNYMYMNASSQVDEDGVRESYFYIDVTSGETVTDADSVEATEEGFTLDGQVSEYPEEDGSFTSDCCFTLTLSSGESVTLSFQLNHAQPAFADPFAGREIVALSAADLSGETESEAMNQLMGDAMGLTGGLFMLSSDEGVIKLSGMLAEGIGAEVDAEYSYEADTEEYSEEYSEENPENLDAAIAAYGHEVPGVIIPEGCVPVYAYALDGYMSVDYEGEDSYFGVSMYYMDDVNDTATLLLGSDGSFTEPEGIIVNISQDEEGSVYYVDAAIGNTSLSIYSYDGNMRIEDVQAMLAGVI